MSYQPSPRRNCLYVLTRHGRAELIIVRRDVLRTLIMLGLFLLLAGCQLLPIERRQSGEPPRASVLEQWERAGQPVDGSLEAALELLQDGREKRARRLLQRLLELDPDNPTAQLVLAQIEQPPEEILGRSFEQIEVQPNDSLSAIAGRKLGNELLFYSLARLNDIKVPRLVQPGQRILVPRGAVETAKQVEAAQTQEIEPAKVASAPAEKAQPDGTAQRLIKGERYRQAYALLLSTARSGSIEAADRQSLADVALTLAEQACNRDDPDTAARILDQAAPWVGANAESGEFARWRRHVAARLLLDQAAQALTDNDQDAAVEALLTARAQADDLRARHAQALSRLEVELSEHYHDLALSAWRDQQVDQAVALWERVIEIRPDFEPALRYLERARRAQQKLRMLEADEAFGASG